LLTVMMFGIEYNPLRELMLVLLRIMDWLAEGLDLSAEWWISLDLVWKQSVSQLWGC
jgi:hypothetical protein